MSFGKVYHLDTTALAQISPSETSTAVKLSKSILAMKFHREASSKFQRSCTRFWNPPIFSRGLMIGKSIDHRRRKNRENSTQSNIDHLSDRFSFKKNADAAESTSNWPTNSSNTSFFQSEILYIYAVLTAHQRYVKIDSPRKRSVQLVIEDFNQKIKRDLR